MQARIQKYQACWEACSKNFLGDEHHYARKIALAFLKKLENETPPAEREAQYDFLVIKLIKAIVHTYKLMPLNDENIQDLAQLLTHLCNYHTQSTSISIEINYLEDTRSQLTLLFEHTILYFYMRQHYDTEPLLEKPLIKKIFTAIINHQMPTADTAKKNILFSGQSILNSILYQLATKPDLLIISLVHRLAFELLFYSHEIDYLLIIKNMVCYIGHQPALLNIVQMLLNKVPSIDINRSDLGETLIFQLINKLNYLYQVIYFHTAPEIVSHLTFIKMLVEYDLTCLSCKNAEEKTPIEIAKKDYLKRELYKIQQEQMALEKAKKSLLLAAHCHEKNIKSPLSKSALPSDIFYRLFSVFACDEKVQSATKTKEINHELSKPSSW